MGTTDAAGEDLEATGDDQVTGGLPTHRPLRNIEALSDAAQQSASKRGVSPLLDAGRTSVRNETGPLD